ncbi:MAG: ABC transporter permease subunit [Actinomycetota bacterium]|nr:ABC transporter permease subunit [Actinomycetota bacterium]
MTSVAVAVAGGARRPARRAKAIGTLLASLPVLVTVVFVGVPVVLAVLYTLGDVHGLNSAVASVAQHQVVARHGLTLGAYAHFFESAELRSDLVVTVVVTVVQSLVLVALALALGLFVRFGRGWLTKVVSTLYVVPMFVPVVIASFALVTFWEDRGKLAGFLALFGLPHSGLPGYTTAGVVLGLVWTNLPFAVILIGSGLQGVPDALIEAARDAGAKPLRVLRRVILPAIRLPLVIVIVFSATGALGAYTVPDLMGPNAPQMLGVAMTGYFQSFGQPQMAEVMAVIVFLGAIGLAGIYLWANRASALDRGARG